MTDLYNTGCRSRELLEVDRWKDLGGEYELTTFKTEEKRIIDKSLLSYTIKEAITEGMPPYYGLTYDQATKEFRRAVALHPIYSGYRIADTYLFRYNRARKMFDATNDIKAVMDFFGWQSMGIANSYIVKPLEFREFEMHIR